MRTVGARRVNAHLEMQEPVAEDERVEVLETSTALTVSRAPRTLMGLRMMRAILKLRRTMRMGHTSRMYINEFSEMSELRRKVEVRMGFWAAANEADMALGSVSPSAPRMC